MKEIKAKFLGVYYFWNNSEGLVCNKIDKILTYVKV